jgi:hypothetical protein
MNWESQKRKKYAPIVTNNNGKLISEPAHVAKLFNAYSTETADRLCQILPLGYLNIPTVIKNFHHHNFFHPQMMMKLLLLKI